MSKTICKKEGGWVRLYVKKKKRGGNRGGEPRKYQLHENAMAQVAWNTVSVNQHEPMPSTNHDSSNQPSYTKQNKIM